MEIRSYKLSNYKVILFSYLKIDFGERYKMDLMKMMLENGIIIVWGIDSIVKWIIMNNGINRINI